MIVLPFCAAVLTLQLGEAPRELRATAIPNPLGLLVHETRLEWRAEGQRAFEVLVATDEARLAAGVGDVWDSGRRAGTESRARFHPDGDIADGAVLWWKVRVWDAAGAVSSFSEASRLKLSDRERRMRPRPTRASEGRLEFVAGRLGRALRMGADRPTVAASDHPGLRTREATTICAWIRPERATDRWQCIYRKEDGDHRRLLAIGEEGPFFGLWSGFCIAGEYREIGAPLDRDTLVDGEWHHVAVSFDGRALRLYLDGQRLHEERVAGPLGDQGRATAHLGCFEGTAEFFEGSLDDVRVYTTAVSDAGIARLAAGEEGVDGAALAGHWRLDGDVENSCRDSSAVGAGRVVLVGGSIVADMERHGFFESALTLRWPGRDLTLRNLGWPGDDVVGTARSQFEGWSPRPAGQAPRGPGYEALLEQVRAAAPETILVGYGAEAAFAESDSDVERFVVHYTRLLDDLAATGARLVLLTPTRHEASGRVLPDPSAHNARLAQAALRILELGASRSLKVVDLYNLVRAPEGQRYTDNGVQSTEAGHRAVAAVLARELGLATPAPALELDERLEPTRIAGLTLLERERTRRGVRLELRPDRLGVPGVTPPIALKLAAAGRWRVEVDGVEALAGDPSSWPGLHLASATPEDPVELLRAAVVDKNREIRRRLRPMNETYILLFRRHEMGHLAHELEDFDELASKQEAVVARLRVPGARSVVIERIEDWRPPRDYPDHEVPRDIPAPDVEAERAAMRLADGLEVDLFAREPMVANPISLHFDRRGRAWVPMSSTYPHIVPGREPDDRIVILEDVDRDGRADRCTEFADGLLVPHSVLPVEGGAWVCSTTELLFLADHDGDDRADERRVVFSGFGNADVHHLIHGLRWAPWGEIYFLQSIYINSFVETAWGHRRLNGSGIWRLRPETERLEVFARGLVNPWGHTFDDWGQSFATDGAGGQGPHHVFPGAAFQSAVGAGRILPGMVRGNPKGIGAEFVTGRHLPPHWLGNLLESDFRANRTVRYAMREDGSGYAAEEAETIIHSAHRSFRPVDLQIGPDGALYVVDWYNPIIDHGEVDFHHPLRDRAHGRIWRIRAKDRPLLAWPVIAEATIPELLEQLRAAEAFTREKARRELCRRPRAEVARQLDRWQAQLDPAQPGFEHDRLEALWLHESLELEDEALLDAVLASAEPRARAAAVRAVSRREGGAGDLARLARAIDDEHPRVRLEAVNALRGIGSLAAVRQAFRALKWPLDEALDYSLWLTARELRELWLPALHAGQDVFGEAGEHLRFALEATGDARSVGPLVALLDAGQVDVANEANVLRAIALLGGSAELDRLLDAAADDAARLITVAEGARHNAERPGRTQRTTAFLADPRAAVRTAAATLCGIWDVQGATPSLIAIVEGATTAEERTAAATALASLQQFEALAELSGARFLADVRSTAVAAWARARGAEAGAAAIDVLREVNAPRSEAVFRAFLDREDGPAVLAEALGRTPLSAEVAVQGIRQVRASGREMPELIEALGRAGALRKLEAGLAPAEREQLLADVPGSGDATRGEAIYRRPDLGCVRCHQIGAEGGQVGPELGSIGVHMTPASILDALLDPSATIKQGFETTVVFATDGTVQSGVLQRRSDDATLIRDTDGTVLSIPNDQIDELRTSKVSMMPAGLTAELRRDELLDLMKFLIDLGR